MKTFIFLALAFVLAGSVAVISITSAPSSARAEQTASRDLLMDDCCDRQQRVRPSACVAPGARIVGDHCM